MITQNTVLIGVVTYNDSKYIESVLLSLLNLPLPIPYKIFVVNDASTDNTMNILERYLQDHTTNNLIIEHNTSNSGIGYGIQKIITRGIEDKYTYVVIMAGNGKDNPREIHKLLSSLQKHHADYVQGSRFLKGGRYPNLPATRFILIKIYSLVFSLLTHVRLTDATNGFRAYRLSIFKENHFDYKQTWLHRYEFETYLSYKVAQLGYNIIEVPVSKNYPSDKKEYSKIRPIIDWWNIVKPLVLLTLHIRR